MLERALQSSEVAGDPREAGRCTQEQHRPHKDMLEKILLLSTTLLALGTAGRI